MKKFFSIILALTLVLGLALTASAAGNTSVTVSIADYATANNWSDATQYTTLQMDSVIKVTMSGSSNTGKYYVNGNNWRMYQTESATLKIEATGSTIVSVKVTYESNKTGCLTNGTTTVTSGTTVEVGADSFTFGIGNTGSATNGQVRVTAITVVYGDASASCTHQYVNEYDATCELCSNGDRTVDLPAANSVITYEQAQKLYDAGVTDVIYKVTGVIKEVYNTQYGNMYIKDDAGNEFTVYGLYTDNGNTRYDAMTTKPIADDTITVSGKLTAYKGVVQMASAWLVEHTPAQRETCTEHQYTNEYDATCNNAGCTTGDRTVTLPAADSELTFDVAEKICAAQDHNTFTADKYKLTGKIIEIYNEQYGNMKIQDANGTIITLYGTYSADGFVGYAEMAEKPAVGDTITVYGILGRYNTTMQMKNGWIVEQTPAGPSKTGDTTAAAFVALMVLSAGALVVTKKRFGK